MSALCLLAIDLRSSWLESRLLSALASHSRFSAAPGRNAATRSASSGPYDRRLGYSTLLGALDRLAAHGYQVKEQARTTGVSAALTKIGLSPIYPEKAQAGLRILDRDGKALYATEYPQRVYPDFNSIPPLVVNTLLFIENRDLLDKDHPYRNPAIEWDRLTKAVLNLGIHAVDRGHPVIGGSTLATQLEKMRHSPGGRTGSVGEKFRQVASASLRAYSNGPQTLDSQRQIVRDYINSIPLAATRSTGEVIGLEDGLHAWYGADVAQVNRLLFADEETLTPAEVEQRAQAYRQVLSMFLALRSPSHYLVRHREALVAQTDRYLRALYESRVISKTTRDLGLAARPQVKLRTPAKEEDAGDFVGKKAPNAIRASLLPLIGLDNLYALDRMDLTVRTTIDNTAEERVAKFLESISTNEGAEKAGLHQYQLLEQGNPASVIYSVTLYERGKGANLLRVQTDNYDQPLNINQGTKLELGSTAKLRTLINYLEIVAKLHQQYSAATAADLKSIEVAPGDNLTKWAISYLSDTKDRSLKAMLEAALQRKYSGNPGEAFFTAGGLHSFENFERFENSENFTVSSGFHHSVNLVFVRLMRDIERYYMFRVPNTTPLVLTDADAPDRRKYLTRFADYEGAVFMRRFYGKYRGLSPDEALEKVAANAQTPLRAAVIYRTARPNAGLWDFSKFMQAHVPAALLTKSMEEYYMKYGPNQFDLQDRGYLAHVHPLELWLVDYLRDHPKATFAEVEAQSAAERQMVYRWLLKSPYKHAQDKRIMTLLEIDAFQEIHKDWKRLGYPFESLVPSYATSIGVSGDTPAALAELAGILVNGGVRYPTQRIEEFQFATGTPWQTTLARKPGQGEQVLLPEIAQLVRREMIGVVENGTAARARGGIRLPDGMLLPVGGKTGTGDNRFDAFSARGRGIGSRVMSRTAAFVFFVGDRYFGTILAFVPGKEAGNYKFTSALAVQIFKDLTPSLLPVIAKAEPEHFEPSRLTATVKPTGQVNVQ